MTADDLITFLQLSPLPWEGGWYRETWRSKTDISAECLGNEYEGARAAGTAIYYLLTPDTVSRMHRLPSDETFHFYLGDPVDMLLLYPDEGHAGASEIMTFGQNLAEGQRVQFTVPGNTWMGARLKSPAGQGFALMGTTVSPGFDFADLEMSDGHDLAGKYPDMEEIISLLS